MGAAALSFDVICKMYKMFISFRDMDIVLSLFK